MDKKCNLVRNIQNMNKTIIFSTITGTVVYFLFEWLFYEVLFTSLHPKPNSMLFILLGSLLGASRHEVLKFGAEQKLLKFCLHGEKIIKNPKPKAPHPHWWSVQHSYSPQRCARLVGQRLSGL